MMIMERTQPSYLRLHDGLGFMILMAVVIGTYGQNVQVGEASFEIGVEATVTCTFDVAPGETLYTVHWAASAEKPTSFPTSAIIIQYVSTASDPVSVPNEEKYGGRVNLTDSYSLVINATQEDLATPWYACQANVELVFGFNFKEAARIARGAMSSENPCTANSGSSQFACKEGDTLTCTVDGFTPNTDDFELDWNAEALVIGEKGDLTISDDPTQVGYFTASRTLTIKPTEATEPISVFCTARGKAFMYAESGRLVGNPVFITVEGTSTTSMMEKEEIMGKEEVTTPTKNVGAIVGGVFGGIVVIGGVVGGVVYVCVYKEKN